MGGGSVEWCRIRSGSETTTEAVVVGDALAEEVD